MFEFKYDSPDHKRRTFKFTERIENEDSYLGKDNKVYYLTPKMAHVYSRDCLCESCVNYEAFIHLKTTKEGF